MPRQHAAVRAAADDTAAAPRLHHARYDAGGMFCRRGVIILCRVDADMPMFRLARLLMPRCCHRERETFTLR